jgi:hypothetical protein
VIIWAYPLIRQALQIIDYYAEQCSDDGFFEVFLATAQVMALYLL